METHLGPGGSATYIRIPDYERPSPAEFRERVNFEAQEDGQNLINIAQNPDLTVDQMSPTTYSDHNNQLWQIFSPKSELAQEYGTAIDASQNPELAENVTKLINAFPEIQHGAARAALGSKQVRKAYEELNQIKVPSAWLVETVTQKVTPRPNDKGELVNIGLGESLVWMFGMADKFVKPEVLRKKHLTHIIPLVGQMAVNTFKSRPNLGKVKDFKRQPEQTPPTLLDMFREDLSHDPEATAKHMVVERELDENGDPQNIVDVSDDYSRIAPPEPSKVGKEIIDNLSDDQIKSVTIKQARQAFPTRADFEYFMFVKRALQAEKDDEL